MNAEMLSSICAALLSLAASYIPGFSSWYAALDGALKRLVMLGLLAAVSAASYGLACAGLGGPLDLSLSCDGGGALTLLRAFLAALVSNQAVFTLSKRGQS